MSSNEWEMYTYWLWGTDCRVYIDPYNRPGHVIINAPSMANTATRLWILLKWAPNTELGYRCMYSNLLQSCSQSAAIKKFSDVDLSTNYRITPDKSYVDTLITMFFQRVKAISLALHTHIFGSSNRVGDKPTEVPVQPTKNEIPRQCNCSLDVLMVFGCQCGGT